MIYSEIIKSKDGFDIPLFKSKKLVHSKYSPINESKNFGNDINKNSLFTIILGLGGGYHIKNFLEKNQNQFILVIENSIEDILFLSQIECVKNLLNKKNVLIISKEKVYESLVNNYLPHIFGGINILSLRTWIDENSNFQSQTSQNENSINKKYINENSNFEKHNNVDFILKEINDCIKFISSDFSVQCHFGNIWQKNIFSNLLIAQKNQLKLFQNKLNNKNFETQQNTFFNFQTKKVAAIIAAGPSLDFTISKIKKNRDNYFIIATDTAISILIKNDLTFDAAISIDGQNVS